MQEDKNTNYSHMVLSTTWLELLGKLAPAKSQGSTLVPSLESDPWSSLLQSQEVKSIDLQEVHLPISDEEIEQLLVNMQDSSTSHPEL